MRKRILGGLVATALLSLFTSAPQALAGHKLAAKGTTGTYRLVASPLAVSGAPVYTVRGAAPCGASRFSFCTGSETRWTLIRFSTNQPPRVVGTAVTILWEFSLLHAQHRTWHQFDQLTVESVSGELRAPSQFVLALECAGCKASGAHHWTFCGVGCLHHTKTFEFNVGSPPPAGRAAHFSSQATVVTWQAAGAVGSSRQAALIARCDNLIPRVPGGCVNPTFAPTFNLTDPRLGIIRLNIAANQRQKAPHWGWQGHGYALTRTTDQTLKARNNRRACPPRMKRPPGWTCDEYPFASTYQGASRYPKYYSAWLVPDPQNAIQGGLLNAFNVANRVLDRDAFWVNVY